MEVKPGYKQTEVGVIPEEWEVAPFGELRQSSDSGAISAERAHRLSSDGYPCIRWPITIELSDFDHDDAVVCDCQKQSLTRTAVVSRDDVVIIAARQRLGK